MALIIESEEAERLAVEVAELAGESKTKAVTVALRERRDRLVRAKSLEERKAWIRRVFEEKTWPLVPPEVLDQPPLTKAEREEILGIGPEGY